MHCPALSGYPCLHCRRLVPQPGCTKHVSRVARHYDGGYREGWPGSLCPRNVSVPSYRPTPRKGCTSVCASEAQVSGEGQPHYPEVSSALYRESEQASNQPPRAQGYRAYMLLRVQRRSVKVCQNIQAQADPVKVQFGRRLAHSAPLTIEKLVQVEGGVTL